MNSTTVYQTDESIISGIQNGDDNALRHLYSSRFDMVKSFIVKNNGDMEDAKDLYQEALIVFLKKIQSPDFSLTSSINTYIYSVCRNLWLKQLKKKERFTTVDINDSEGFIKIEDKGAYDQDLEMENTAKEEATINAMQQMGDPCKSILYKYYFYKSSMEEIATEMGYKSAKIAKNQKYKCMKRLQKIVLSNIA